MEKASDKEQEYFLKQEMERLKKLREEHMAKMKEDERRKMKELHYLHCAKCGQKMETTTLQDVEIEVCPDCGGIYLDSGELARLVDEQKQGSLSKALAMARKFFAAA